MPHFLLFLNHISELRKMISIRILIYFVIDNMIGKSFEWEHLFGFLLAFFLLCNFIPHYNTKGDTLFELWIEAKKTKLRRVIKAGKS